MTRLRKMMLEELERRNYAEATTRCYIRTVEDFSRRFKCSPEGNLVAYEGLLKSRLMGVLNDRRQLRRGYPVEGLLCGCSSEPIPASGEGPVSGKLTLLDDVGNKVELCIALTVFRPPTRAGRCFQARESLRRRGELFSKPDSVNYVLK